jgi:two-component system, NarL family, response regulator LiaR
MAFLKKFGHIILYGLILAVLVFVLKWLQWKFLIVDNAIDIYIGLIAVFFTILGIWLASQLTRPKVEKIFIEKEITLPKEKNISPNKEALEKFNLTNREYEVLQLIVMGHSNDEIAESLFISLSTVKTHISNLYEKMNVKRRAKAIEMARRLGIA